MKHWIAVIALSAFAATSAQASSGNSCLTVVNVAKGDTLNIRAQPSARASVVDELVPGAHGVLAMRGACTPKSIPWGQRWCPISHSDANGTTKGWVKARFVRNTSCP